MGLSTERRRPNSGAAAMMGPCSAAARLPCSCSRGEAGARCGPPNSAARAQLPPSRQQELQRGSGAAPTPSRATAVLRGEKSREGKSEGKQWGSTAMGERGPGNRRKMQPQVECNMQSPAAARPLPPLATPPPFQITTLEPLY